MSTLRIIVNDQRIATGRVTKDGRIFQVFPTKMYFANEGEWRNSVAKPTAPAPTKHKNLSTVRVIVNDQRIATGRVTKDGRIFQVFPTKMYFANEGEWRDSVTNAITIVYEGKPQKSVAVASTAPVTPTQTPKKIVAPPPTPQKTQQPPQPPYTYSKSTSEILPAGRYYIGDLCYAMKNSIYDDVFGDTPYSPGYYTTQDGCFLVDRTAYGDGAYTGTNGFEYGVDAGIIGIASMGVCNPDLPPRLGGTLHTFTEPVNCKFKNGYFEFSSGSFNLRINTAYD